MCPLRIILVFLSATLAGYFAWKSVRSSGVFPLDGDDAADPRSPAVDPARKNGVAGFGKVIGDGFWVFVDMASGRYLWRSLREAKER